ncbi:Cysteine-rich receptor-kinase-like protein [Quillaja saponaria]|uniref:Cysteine-rich receptor-kinase-like protein n=1 Tax=Quillaja saponaria TaxID=32244 RepID=A0AAD7M0D1_QUISA|nr:Cysteine-rich receptor-kinase-like protein [Quillaja saponaria]
MLRYSSQSFNNIVPSVSIRSSQDIANSDRSRFNQVPSTIFDTLATEASNSQSDKKFTTASERFSNLQTFGYMAPEYAMHGHYSVKSDVFSFGVLVMEIISGKRNTSFYQSHRGDDLLSYTWKHWRDHAPLELLDPTLRNSYSRNEVIRCIHISLLCVQENPADRPTMATIALMLNSYSVTLPLPQQPASFLRGRTVTGPETLRKELDSNQSTGASFPWSVNEVTNTEVYPR